ncbi:MAG TPA: alpha/beta fold hydrolase [Solirubrobacteraceae bacterium]|jgi:pimeloyl-ACP methyl ester carboxylesterase
MARPSLAADAFPADDGITLIYHQLGAGRPVVLLHGYMLPALPTWVDSGIAERLADCGNRVIMPDMRGHGESVPADESAYPPDALTSDVLALIAHLGLTDYDLGGYSLGGRVVARALTRGVIPRRAFIGGTGLEPIVHAEGRGENYRRILGNLGTFAPGTPEADLEGYLRQTGGNPAALIRVLDTFVDTPRDALTRVTVPALVIAGEQDGDRGSVEDLAATLPRSTLRRVPGNHFTALYSPELTDHLVRFLGSASGAPASDPSYDAPGTTSSAPPR